jgi:hypothetical protein
MKYLKRSIIVLLSLSNFYLPLKVTAAAGGSKTYICNLGDKIIFTKEVNGNLNLNIFKGDYSSFSKEQVYQEIAKIPDIIFENGSTSYSENNTKQSLMWKTGRYVYQVVAPTPRIEVEFSGYMIVKRKNKIVSNQRCFRYD